MTCQNCARREGTRAVDYRGIAQRWCDVCVSQYCTVCADCVTQAYRGYYENDEGVTVCYGCSQNYFSCEECGERFSTEQRCEGNGRFCNECGDPVIDSHDASVDMDPLGKGPHFFGVELEVECFDGERPQGPARESLELLQGFAIAKSDGSLHSGFELVTRPATLEIQRAKWQPFFERKPSCLRSFRTETCGLHVHTSRAPLSELTIAKIVCFTNAAHNRKFIATIAGREKSQWANFKHKKLGDGNKTNPSRYEAVNLQNEHTIEFRIFKGTLKPEAFYKAIEFVDALIHFCAPCERSLKDSMSRTLFCDYVAKHRKLWPHLDAFIQARWLGVTNKLTEKYRFKAGVNNEQEDNQ